MSERVLKVLLSELANARIVCKCGVAVEMKVEKLIGCNGLNCPSCGTPFQIPDTKEQTSLAALAKQIATIQTTSNFKLEFVIPEAKDKPKD